MYDAAWFKKVCEDGPEVQLYLVIQGIGGYVFYMEHDMADGRIPEKDWAPIDKDLAVARKQQQEAVAHLTRFGLAQPMKENGVSTPEYWNWYRWWKNYIDSLPQAEMDALGAALNKGEDVSKWRPRGSWKLITFEFDDKKFTAPFIACDLNRIVLPDGRVLRARKWLDGDPPRPEGLRPLKKFWTLPPEEIAEKVKGVVAEPKE